jgi:hypothetical protein
LKNKITAINNLAILVPVYRFGVAGWLRRDNKKMDWETEMLPTIERIHRPKADINSLYIKRQKDMSPHVMLLLFISASTLSSVKINLPDWYKSMMEGKTNTLCKRS